MEDHRETTAPEPRRDRSDHRAAADAPDRDRDRGGADRRDPAGRVTNTSEALPPWSNPERVAAIRRMYALDHLATVDQAAAELGLTPSGVREVRRRMRVGRVVFGAVRFSRDELERMAWRPDGRINRHMREE